MKIFILVIMLLEMTTLFAQKTIKSLGFTRDSISINTNIKIKDTISFKQLKIVFEEVLSDSRCPGNFKCPNIGMAIILMKIYDNGHFVKNKKVSVDGEGYIFDSKNLIYELERYKIYISELYPRPVKKSSDILKEYNADFFVKTVRN